MNNPEFVGFLLSTDRKTFIMQARAKKDFYSVRLRIKQTGKTDKAEAYSYGLCEYIAEINGWDVNCSYRVFGKNYSNQGIAVFDFSSSEQINDEVSDDEPNV